jgi:zinc-ribbon domain
MFCPNCGVQVADKDRFCTSCGKPLVVQQETVLHSFGPWGVNFCFGRPGTFVMMHKNDTKITLTNQKISGTSVHSNKLRFEVSYLAILEKEAYDFLLNLGNWKVLWIKYQEPDKTKEISIMSFLNGQDITIAYDIIQKAQDKLHH